MSVLTPAQLESRLSAALQHLSISDLPSRAQARRTFAKVRRRFGLKMSASTTLTSGPKSITKMTKTRGEVIVSLALTHAKYSGIVNTCPFAGECAFSCVGTSGNGGHESTKRSRRARTRLLVSHPEAFLSLLVHELDDYRRLAGDVVVAARINAYSDIRWERVLPSWFWGHFGDVRFYDYTKHPLASRPPGTMPSNYVLTYSNSERTTDEQRAKNLAAGRNVAVVLSVRGGKQRGTNQYKPIPSRLFDCDVVDGDETDSRHSDPVGVVVALRRKGQLRADSPFVVQVP